MRVLIVEDDTVVRSSLKQRLADAGITVDVAADGEEALFAGLNYPLDAAIVDLGLPKLSGLDVIRAWRARERSFAVVILTGRVAWQDKVEALDAGADDYISKPFSVEEVFARVRAVLRRAHGWTRSELTCGPYVLNTQMRSLAFNGANVDLTTFEYRLLEHLMLRTGQTVSMAELSEHLYSEEIERESNIVAQLIFRLRRKLDPLGEIKPIETVPRDGYRFTVTRGGAGCVSLRRPRSKS